MTRTQGGRNKIPLCLGLQGVQGLALVTGVAIEGRGGRRLGSLPRVLATSRAGRVGRGLEGVLHVPLLVVGAIVLDDGTLGVLVELELDHWQRATEQHTTGRVEGLQLQEAAEGVALMGFHELVDTLLAQVSLTKSLARLCMNLWICVEIIHTLNICVCG